MSTPPVFLDTIRKPDAARLMVEKAEAYGEAQYHTVQSDWMRTAKCFDALSTLEAKFALAI